MNKPPAFQFYAADFLVDARVKLMSLEERGAYVTLLAHAWIEGRLPRELPRLAKLCDVSVADMERIWPAVAPCWAPAGSDSIINPRLEKERQKQAHYRKTQSDKALTRQASPKPARAEPPSSSPSLSSKSTTSRVAGVTWVKGLGKLWCQAYGGTAPFAQIGAHCKVLVERDGLEPVAARFLNYLRATEAKYASPARFAQTYGSWADAGGSVAPDAWISPDAARLEFRAAGIPDNWPVNPDGYRTRPELQRAIDIRLEKIRGHA